MLTCGCMGSNRKTLEVCRREFLRQNVSVEQGFWGRLAAKPKGRKPSDSYRCDRSEVHRLRFLGKHFSTSMRFLDVKMFNSLGVDWLWFAQNGLFIFALCVLGASKLFFLAKHPENSLAIEFLGESLGGLTHQWSLDGREVEMCFLSTFSKEFSWPFCMSPRTPPTINLMMSQHFLLDPPLRSPCSSGLSLLVAFNDSKPLQ